MTDHTPLTDEEPEYVQLSSWDELIEFIEDAWRRAYAEDWAQKTGPEKKRKKKTPPQSEGLF